jgi:hypothetical protein
MKSANLLREFGALLLLMLAVAAVFGDVVAGNARLWGDFVSWYFPSREYLAECLRAHRLPLWNPFMDAGMPFLGEADHGLFYPPALLLQPVSRHRLILYRFLEFFVLAHTAWAAISMYLLARSLRCRRWAALVAGIAYGLGGSFWARSAHLSLLCAQSWAPAAIGGAFHAARGAWLGLPVAALAIGMIGLSGSPASLVVILVGLAVVSMTGALSDGNSRSVLHRLARGLLVTAAIATVGILLSCAQLLPMLEFVALSERSAYTYAEMTDYSATPGSLVMLLIPRFYGWLDFDRLSYWGPNNFPELSAYVGILPLLLAPFALRRRSWRETAPWLALSVVGLWMALGAYGGLHYLIYRSVPFVGMMRAPGRYQLIWAFGVSLLAALGLDAAQKARWGELLALRRLRGRVATVTITAMAMALLYYPTQLAGLESWKQPFFEGGMRRSAASWASALGSVVLLGQAGTVGSWAAPVAAVTLGADVAWQASGVGLLFDNQPVHDLMLPNEYEKLLANDKSLFRVRNPFEPASRLMLSRLQSDSGPGRHLLGYQNYEGRIASHYSPMLDLLNVKYLAELENGETRDRSPNLVIHEYVPVSRGAEAALPVRPAMLCHAVDVVSNVTPTPATRKGAKVADLEIVGENGGITTLPIRFGFETGDVSGGEPIAAGREIVPSYYINVTDSATLSRKHYLTRLEFPPVRVRELRLRHAGGDEELWVKELYLQRVEGESDSWKRIYSEPSLNDTWLQVYESSDVLPRAFLVGEAEYAGNRKEALDLVAGEGFDPRRQVILEGPSGNSGSAGPAGDVTVTSYAAERIALSARVNAAGAWLVLSEMDYPGWTARVDGASARILRANSILRALRLPAGEHTVVFEYQPESLRHGLQLTAAGGLLLVSMLGDALWRAKRTVTATAS